MSFFGNRRRSRGYAFEKSIVNYFEGFHFSEDWNARRLGGSSVGLPDVVVTNNKKLILFAIEAKSSFADQVYIPNDQILRCLDTCHVFSGGYKKKYMVFAFKFSANKAMGRDKLQYYFFKVIKFENLKNIQWVKCFYDGRLRYKLIDKEQKNTKLQVIQYNSLLHLKENIIVKPLDA